MVKLEKPTGIQIAIAASLVADSLDANKNLDKTKVVADVIMGKVPNYDFLKGFDWSSEVTIDELENDINDRLGDTSKIDTGIRKSKTANLSLSASKRVPASSVPSTPAGKIHTPVGYKRTENVDIEADNDVKGAMLFKKKSKFRKAAPLVKCPENTQLIQQKIDKKTLRAFCLEPATQ